MPVQVVAGAMLTCPFGTGPLSYVALPKNKVMAGGPPAANIMDNIPFVNIMPAPMCTSMANPAVASATSAASGVLTPMPCTPVTPAPWTPGASKSMIANMPALHNGCTIQCVLGQGTITVSNPGQTKVMVS